MDDLFPSGNKSRRCLGLSRSFSIERIISSFESPVRATREAFRNYSEMDRWITPWLSLSRMSHSINTHRSRNMMSSPAQPTIGYLSRVRIFFGEIAQLSRKYAFAHTSVFDTADKTRAVPTETTKIRDAHRK